MDEPASIKKLQIQYMSHQLAEHGMVPQVFECYHWELRERVLKAWWVVNGRLVTMFVGEGVYWAKELSL